MTDSDMDAERAWGPAPWMRTTAAVCALVAGGWWALDHNAENRLVAATVTVMCVMALLILQRIRIRLRAGSLGLDIVGPLHRLHVDWQQVLDIRIAPAARMGHRNVTVEIDIAAPQNTAPDDVGQLFVFGTFDLGTDPAQVAHELRQLRAAH